MPARMRSSGSSSPRPTSCRSPWTSTGWADPAVVDDPDVAVASPGFYRQGSGNGTTVVPQFLIGVPAWLSVGMWLGGWTGLLLMPALFMALAIVSLGALTAATIGPRWAPLVAAATALTAPVLHAARSTYSEPAALLALSAALTLLASATEVGARSSTLSIRLSRRIGAFSGLLLGGAGLVRLDALREVVLMIPVVGAARHATASGRSAARPGCDREYGAVRPGLPAAEPAVPAPAGRLAAPADRAGRAPGRGRVPRAAAGPPAGERPARRAGRPMGSLAALAASPARSSWSGVGLATRPWWMTGHTTLHDPSRRSVARAAGGAGADRRRHPELHRAQPAWVSWWVGPAALLLAFAGAVVAAYRCGVVVGRWRPLLPWIGPFVVGLGSTAPGAVRPGITPDHPWADRRLVVSVLPDRPAARRRRRRGAGPAGSPARTAAGARPGRRRGLARGHRRRPSRRPGRSRACAPRWARWVRSSRSAGASARRRRRRRERARSQRVDRGHPWCLPRADGDRARAAHLDPDPRRAAGADRCPPAAPAEGPGRGRQRHGDQ